mmetsp:Transcript_6767/g.18277  ORF Transcript_6767/g.18277 Transcript_6767/m.18277 type:complete len:299 (-) Transcript_6767:21-917(-)
MASVVPAHEKPRGKSKFAIWQTSLPTACSLQSFSKVSWSTPKTESMACGLLFAASAMASPRSFTSCMPSSKVKTPAAQRAVYSPSDRPATAPGLSTASGRISRSLMRPAMPPRNMHGWQMLVSSSLLSGPLRQYSRGFQPRIASAELTICLTSGVSLRVDSMLTYCEPCPGKRSATVVGGGPAGCAGSAGFSEGTTIAGTAAFFGMKCSGFSSAALTLAALTWPSKVCCSSAAFLTADAASSSLWDAACTRGAAGAAERPLPSPRRHSEVRASSAASKAFLLTSPAATASASVVCAAS